MRMFYIEHDETGTNLSQFVMAEDYQRAIRLWQVYWSSEEQGGCMIEPDTQPSWVCEVPSVEMLTKWPRAIPWDNVSRMYDGHWREA